MAKFQGNAKVGDTKAPALQPTETGLRSGSDQAAQIIANQPGFTPRTSVLSNCLPALKSASLLKGSPAICKQSLWLTFFFDGTGNNREFDLELSKHSNIARLYRAHRPKSQSDGILPVYIQGVGTYFPEIGDDGGSALGLGCGAMGEERLKFALKQFDNFLALPLARARAPENAIREINIAVFGFSRGAALARAFVNMVMKERCELRRNKWALKNGAWPVRFRFLGLFDTVASVGLPMSSNITGIYESLNDDISGIIENRLENYRLSRPNRLAFSLNGAPGADPSPGPADGHKDWGGMLKIHETVEEVRHFIAAHEIRNSFPVDSISTISNGWISKPGHFYETVYPGAHSDVGGGYAPGEGGKSLVSVESLSLIPLRDMYDCALKCGVPMLAEWNADNKADFIADSTLCGTYNHYIKNVGSFAALGDGLNKHMSLYYAWRFMSIKRKAQGDQTEAKVIQSQDRKYRKQEAVLIKEMSALEAKEAVAKMSLNSLMVVQDMQAEGLQGNGSISVTDSSVKSARQKYEIAHSERLRAKARKDSLPNMRNFQTMLSLYDKQLLEDVVAIRTAIETPSSRKNRSELRPHYRAMLEAYENEFEKNSGLKDEKIISFFDNYVHDSLAGFAKDATLPSDPRVVYLGGDEKYMYASLEKVDSLLMGQETGLA